MPDPVATARYLQGGDRLYFKRDSEGATDFPLIGLGVVNTVTPSVDITEIELRDNYCGQNRLVTKRVTQADRTFEFSLADFNVDNLALAFLADPPTKTTIAATQATDVVQAAADVHAGELLLIKDANGDPVPRLTSVDSVKLNDDSATTENTDWRLIDADLGLIEIIAGGLITDGEQIKVTYTPVAHDRYRINPDTATVLEGDALWARCSNSDTDLQKYHARMSLIPSGMNFAAGEFADHSITATVLSDVTNTSEPAGHLDVVKGG